MEEQQSRTFLKPEKLPPLVPTTCNKADPFMTLIATAQMMDDGGAAGAQTRLQMQYVGHLEAQLGRERGKLDEMMARITNAKVIESYDDARTPKGRSHHRLNPMATEGQGKFELIGEKM